MAAALLPLAATATAYALSIRLGLVPACNPFVEGCVSISRAARHDLPNILFRALVLPAALLQAACWAQRPTAPSARTGPSWATMTRLSASSAWRGSNTGCTSTVANTVRSVATTVAVVVAPAARPPTRLVASTPPSLSRARQPQRLDAEQVARRGVAVEDVEHHDVVAPARARQEVARVVGA